MEGVPIKQGEAETKGMTRKRDSQGTRGGKEKRGNCNITPCLHSKLRRRIMYKGHESEADIRGNWGTSHV